MLLSNMSIGYRVVHGAVCKLSPAGAIALVVACSILSACIADGGQTNAPAQGKAARPPDSAVVSSTCEDDIVTTRKDALVAEHMTPGDTHYIEFRLRPSPVLPSGHIFVVYGELDENGVPKTYNYTGLYPKGSFFGLYAGIISQAAMPANLEPSILDCHVMPTSAYRHSLTADQFQRLLAKVDFYKANPPRWAVLSFNCNHYAASLGKAAGLKVPQGTRSLQFLSVQYFGQLVRANGDVISRS